MAGLLLVACSKNIQNPEAVATALKPVSGFTTSMTKIGAAWRSISSAVITAAGLTFMVGGQVARKNLHKHNSVGFNLFGEHFEVFDRSDLNKLSSVAGKSSFIVGSITTLVGGVKLLTNICTWRSAKAADRSRQVAETLSLNAADASMVNLHQQLGEKDSSSRQSLGRM